MPVAGPALELGCVSLRSKGGLTGPASWAWSWLCQLAVKWLTGATPDLGHSSWPVDWARLELCHASRWSKAGGDLGSSPLPILAVPAGGRVAYRADPAMQGSICHPAENPPIRRNLWAGCGRVMAHRRCYHSGRRQGHRGRRLGAGVTEEAPELPRRHRIHQRQGSR